MWENHKFQFVCFCHVHHVDAVDMGSASVNDDSHLLHITRGEGEVLLDNAHRFALRRGDVVAIPRGAPYLMRIGADFEMLNLHYQLWLEDGRHLEEALRLPYLFHPGHFEGCERKLREMRDLEDTLRRASLAYQVVVEHLAASPLLRVEGKVIDERMARVAKYLGSETCHECDIAAVARIACLSGSQLNRRFKEAFGVSPRQFWERRRLRAVCLRITRTRQTFAEIAEAFAFSSPYYFSRWFKKNVSCSPSAFRHGQTNY